MNDRQSRPVPLRTPALSHSGEGPSDAGIVPGRRAAQRQTLTERTESPLLRRLAAAGDGHGDILHVTRLQRLLHHHTIANADIHLRPDHDAVDNFYRRTAPLIQSLSASDRLAAARTQFTSRFTV